MQPRIRNLLIGVIALAVAVIVLGLFWSLRKPRHAVVIPPPPDQKAPVPLQPPSAIAANPSTSVEIVDQILRNLDWGNVVFTSPEAMKYGQPESVSLLLSPALSVEDLEARLHQKVGAKSARVRISNSMEAQLAGTGFTIQALRPGLQAVTSQQITRWKWEVTPAELGRQTLYLTLSAHIEVEGRDAPLVVRTLHREIQVNITLPQRVSRFTQNNWQWLWAAIIVPIAGYLWSGRKKRKAKSKAKRTGHSG